MYAVIFKTKINLIDEQYTQMASQLRKLAINTYGCTEFVSITEGMEEIAISYWQNQQQIKRWKADILHQIAQKSGKSKWYKSYQVQVVKIIREYEKS